MSKTRIDMAALYDALDAKRHAWGTTWYAVCTSARIPQSTITRWKTAIDHGTSSGIGVENLAALMAWFGETDFGPYLVDAPSVTLPPA